MDIIPPTPKFGSGRISPHDGVAVRGVERRTVTRWQRTTAPRRAVRTPGSAGAGAARLRSSDEERLYRIRNRALRKERQRAAYCGDSGRGDRAARNGGRQVRDDLGVESSPRERLPRRGVNAVGALLGPEVLMSIPPNPIFGVGVPSRRSPAATRPPASAARSNKRFQVAASEPVARDLELYVEWASGVCMMPEDEVHEAGRSDQGDVRVAQATAGTGSSGSLAPGEPHTDHLGRPIPRQLDARRNSDGGLPALAHAAWPGAAAHPDGSQP